MFEIFKTKSETGDNENAGTDNAEKNADESKETKKCLNCLRRVDIEVLRCPHCRSDNFQF